MRRLLVVVAVLAAVLVGADFGLRLLAEQRVATQLQASLELKAKPHVSLGGWPFVTHLLSGELPSASARSSGLVVGGVHVASVALELRDLRFSPSAIASRRRFDITVASGSGSVDLTGDDVTRILRDRGIPLTVRFSGGRALVTSPDSPGEAAANLSLSRGGFLVVAAADAATPVHVAVPLPTLIDGLRYTAVEVDGEVGVVRFRLTRSTVEVAD